jgi:hypothetical protein
MFCGRYISVRKLKARLSATINAPSMTATRSPCRNGVFNFRTAHCGEACYHFHRKNTFGDVLFTVTSGCCVDHFAKHLTYSFQSETTRCLSYQSTTQILHLIGSMASDLLPDERAIWLDILPRFISVSLITKHSQCYMDEGPYIAVTLRVTSNIHIYQLMCVVLMLWFQVNVFP